jgi:hypothetical protein
LVPPRFHALYRAWLERGQPVLDATLSPVLADAVAWGTGQLECYVLPHSYVRLLRAIGLHDIPFGRRPYLFASAAAPSSARVPFRMPSIP